MDHQLPTFVNIAILSRWQSLNFVPSCFLTLGTAPTKSVVSQNVTQFGRFTCSNVGNRFCQSPVSHFLWLCFFCLHRLWEQLFSKTLVYQRKDQAMMLDESPGSGEAQTFIANKCKARWFPFSGHKIKEGLRNNIFQSSQNIWKIPESSAMAWDHRPQ